MFHRSRSPKIDSCGFESYSLACTACDVALAGIIDPCDETLLLSEDAGAAPYEAIAVRHSISSAPTLRRRLLG